MLPVPLIGACFSLQTASVQSAPSHIDNNTPVEIQLLTELSSKSVVPGQIFPFEVTKPVIIAGVKVIESGTVVIAEVMQVQAAGKTRKKVALELIFWPVRLSDGSTIQLGFKGPRLNKMRTTSRGTQAVGAALSTLYLPFMVPLAPAFAALALIDGKSFTVSAGQRYKAYVISSTLAEEGQTDSAEVKPAERPPKLLQNDPGLESSDIVALPAAACPRNAQGIYLRPSYVSRRIAAGGTTSVWRFDVRLIQAANERSLRCP
jgi:hypothetical protein